MTIKASNFPTVRPTLDLNFAQTKRLDPRITYSRSSSATYYDNTGVLRTAAANQARFDHDPTTGESLGLLVEEARTNELTYSEKLDDASWTKSNVTVIPNTALAPDQTLTAYSVYPTSPGTARYVYKNLGASSSAIRTNSVFAKANGKSWMYLYGSNGSAAVFFNLSNGTVGTVGAGVTGSINAIGNGWYRCSVTQTAATTGRTLFVGPTDADGSTSITVSGTSGILIWGAQLEQGSFPTSYIPTPATFTSRSTTATYYDANGTIQTAGINVARDNAYFPDENGVFKPAGLLLEAAGTNIKTNSQVFTSGWNPSGIDPITQNTSITTPEGLTDGVGVITESSGGTVHQVYSSTTVQYTGYYSYSIFVKPNGRNYVVLSDSTFTHNLSDGTTTGSPSGEFISAKTEKLPNGWYRCSLVRLHNNTFDQFNLKLADGPGSTSYSGDGVSGVYIWGAQQEVSTYPTSYIPTTSSTVTRAADVSSSSTVTRSADVAQITGSNFSSWYNQSEGTLMIQSKSLNTVTNGQAVASFGYANDLIRSSTIVGARWGNTGASNVVNTSANPFILAAAYINGTELRAAGNGILGNLDTSVNTQSNTSLSFGSQVGSGGTGNHSGTHARLTYYPVRLPDATLQTITS